MRAGASASEKQCTEVDLEFESGTEAGGCRGSREVRVVKNTLVRRAVAETPFAALADRMVGPLAYGIGPDPVALAKVLNDFAKSNEKFVITGGAMPGQVMSAKEIAALAALPSREELIARLLGTMQAPIAKLVRTLNEIPSRLVRTLAAVRDAKAAS